LAKSALRGDTSLLLWGDCVQPAGASRFGPGSGACPEPAEGTRAEQHWICWV